MTKNENYAFIDGNNLYLGVKTQKIKLDYGKLRKYLRNKFNVKRAFLFIGYDAKNVELYNDLQKYGYTLVFKPTVIYTDEKGTRSMKGNVDAELVLYAAAVEYKNYDRAVIISSDGDFTCLIRFLLDKKKLAKIITPTSLYSKLLRPFGAYILPIKDIKDKISKEKK